MAVAYFARIPNISPDQARQIMAGVQAKLAGRRPEGALYHAEGPSEDGGWWALNVWETDDHARQFAHEYLQPVLSSLNIPPPHQERLAVEWETSQMPEGAG